MLSVVILESVSHSSDWPQTHYVAMAGFELLSPLPPPPKSQTCATMPRWHFFKLDKEEPPVNESVLLFQQKGVMGWVWSVCSPGVHCDWSLSLQDGCYFREVDPIGRFLGLWEHACSRWFSWDSWAAPGHYLPWYVSSPELTWWCSPKPSKLS